MIQHAPWQVLGAEAVDQHIDFYAAQDRPFQRARNPLSGSIIFVNIRFKINFIPGPVERRFDGGEIAFSVL